MKDYSLSFFLILKMLELEEIDPVSFKKRSLLPCFEDDFINIDDFVLPEPISSKKKKIKIIQEKQPSSNDDQNSNSPWKDLGLSMELCRALESLEMHSPTPIQAQVLPLALNSRDVLGAAETGSGKTLAYGLPILNYLNSIQEQEDACVALILAPTRELALQVSDHLKKVCQSWLRIKVIFLNNLS
jgi:ATP-dependent RNA helicase DDX24/MAK5